ncbi:hypothetical protein, partial [Burkholderia sp.]|uniref:hypothetical protein n=1 Tax=Burkholderia sp. TaxID=36773 RepID=UPI00258CEC82
PCTLSSVLTRLFVVLFRLRAPGSTPVAKRRRTSRSTDIGRMSIVRKNGIVDADISNIQHARGWLD